MNIDKIKIGTKPPHDVNVIVEIPLGGEPVKYEIDKRSGALFVDRFLHTAMHYPANYGFIPHTLSGDGDPVDVLVITPFPLLAGSIVRSRVLGIVTDGDLRRMLEREAIDYGQLRARDLLIPTPKCIAPDAMAVDALMLLRQHAINQLVVLEGEQYLGMVHLHDLVREGLV